MRGRSRSRRGVVPAAPARRRARSASKSDSASGSPGGTPSSVTPICAPCDSPQIERRKRCPNVFIAVECAFAGGIVGWRRCRREAPPSGQRYEEAGANPNLFGVRRCGALSAGGDAKSRDRSRCRFDYAGTLPFPCGRDAEGRAPCGVRPFADRRVRPPRRPPPVRPGTSSPRRLRPARGRPSRSCSAADALRDSPADAAWRSGRRSGRDGS